MSNESLEQVLSRLLTRTTDEVYCSCPCQVLRVNGNYVDVLAIINDDEPDFPLYHVPIKRMETQNAYVFLKISEGDYGTLTFFDRDTTDYIATGNTEYNYNAEQHSINFRAFELGFVPDPSAYNYTTTALIEIGCKDGKTSISLNKGVITINSTTVNVNATTTNITSATTNITGDVNIDGVLTATSVVPQNGTSGTFTKSITSTNGIVTAGS